MAKCAEPGCELYASASSPYCSLHTPEGRAKTARNKAARAQAKAEEEIRLDEGAEWVARLPTSDDEGKPKAFLVLGAHPAEERRGRTHYNRPNVFLLAHDRKNNQPGRNYSRYIQADYSDPGMFEQIISKYRSRFDEIGFDWHSAPCGLPDTFDDRVRIFNDISSMLKKNGLFYIQGGYSKELVRSGFEANEVRLRDLVGRGDTLANILYRYEGSPDSIITVAIHRRPLVPAVPALVSLPSAFSKIDSELLIACHCEKHSQIYYIKNGVLDTPVGVEAHYVDPTACPEKTWEKIPTNSKTYIWGIHCPVAQDILHSYFGVSRNILNNSWRILKKGGHVIFPGPYDMSLVEPMQTVIDSDVTMKNKWKFSIVMTKDFPFVIASAKSAIYSTMAIFTKTALDPVAEAETPAVPAVAAPAVAAPAVAAPAVAAPAVAAPVVAAPAVAAPAVAAPARAPFFGFGIRDELERRGYPAIASFGNSIVHGVRSVLGTRRRKRKSYRNRSRK